MRYVSTRGAMPPAPFTSVLLEGLAADGGLVVPDEIPRLRLSELESLRHGTYRDVAMAVITPFIDDIPRDDLERIVAATYHRDVFDAPDVISVRSLDRQVHLAGLSHGPTLAFKDMALQLLGELFEYELRRRDTRLTVLGATSGDTGSSAEQAMIGRNRVDVVMLSPLGRISPFQAAQMYSLDQPNIVNLVVRGVFDDCQAIVKEVNADAAFKSRHRIGAVNSINWARVMAQVIYYVAVYLRVVDEVGDQMSFAVPTGNFGNVYAGQVARRMGLPIRRLVLACNENDVLDEFFRSGRYRVRGRDELVATSSPSMDIAKASNLERYVYHLLGDDPARTEELFSRLDAEGSFDLGHDPVFAGIAGDGFVSGTSSHTDRVETIRTVHRTHGVVIDPHTADGIKVGQEHLDEGVPMVCLETALPVKFAGIIEEALGLSPPPPPRFADLLERAQHFEVIDPDPDLVKAHIAARSSGRNPVEI